MRDYELIFIVHPDLDENSFNETVEKVKGWITESGGTIVKEDLWGKRQLAYPIQKQREGQYMYMHVQLEPSFNSELERNMRFLEPVMRYLLTAIHQ